MSADRPLFYVHEVGLVIIPTPPPRLITAEEVVCAFFGVPPSDSQPEK